MGRRHVVAIGVVLLGIVAVIGRGSHQVVAGVRGSHQVVAGGEPAGARASMSRALAHVRPSDEVDLEIDDAVDDDAIDGDPGAGQQGEVDDRGEVLDADGLTLAQRLESAVAELEDRLPANRGALQGRVRDSHNGEYLAGVTVTATSSALAGAQSAITDENGFYTIADLPAGTYLVTFYYLDLTVERPGIDVTARTATSVYQQLAQRPFEHVVNAPDFIEDVEVISSFSGFETVTNTYYVDGIDVTGLTFDSDPETKPDPETGIDIEPEETIE